MYPAYIHPNIAVLVWLSCNPFKNFSIAVDDVESFQHLLPVRVEFCFCKSAAIGCRGNLQVNASSFKNQDK
ncbi:hypothetical protein AC249_AIPGENE23160, partial [Exaiptasia diaphana]